MIINYKKIFLTTLLMLIYIVFGGAIYAQKSVSSEKSVASAADAFYKKYLPQFGYPSAAKLKKLRPILKVNVSCVNKLTLARELTPVSGPGIDGFQYNVYIRSEVEELRKKRESFKKEQVKAGKSSRFGRVSGNRYSNKNNSR